MLGSGRVQLEIAFLVVGLLEQDVGADAGLLELAVVFDRGGCDVDVDAADGAVLVLDAVDGLDALEYVLDGVVDRVLSGLEREALVSHVLQGDDFLSDLLLGQLFAGDVAVLGVIRTVNAAVDAVVGQIERGKHDDAVTIKVLLDLLCQGVNLLVFVLQGAVEQHGCLPVSKAPALARLVQDLIDERAVCAVLLCVVQRLQDLLVVDEVVCAGGFGIVHVFLSPLVLFRVSYTFPSDIPAKSPRSTATV